MEFPAYQIMLVDDLVTELPNARTHTDAQIEQIARSIQQFGFTNPILVKGKQTLAGHGRLLAAKRLGMAEVPTVDLKHLTPEQARAYILADNRLALSAGWDDDILRAEINALRDIGFDVDLTGFSEAEIDQLFVPSATPSQLWAGMPEFNQPDATAFRTIVVHFKDAEGLEAFKKALARPEITEKTRSMWYPPAEIESRSNRHYVTDEENQTNETKTEEKTNGDSNNRDANQEARVTS